MDLLSLKSGWSTKQAPGQPGLHGETLYENRRKGKATEPDSVLLRQQELGARVVSYSFSISEAVLKRPQT